MVDGNTTPLTAALSKGSASVKTFESGATKAFNAVGLASVAALAYAGKQFIDFQSTMVKTVTLAGSSEAAMHSLSQELLSIAPGLGRGPQELADALYQVESSGIPAAQAMKVVTAAAEAASLGLGETAVVADAVTSIINAYGQSANSAALDTAILVSAVREGKGEADAIAGAIGRVIPLASQMGVGIDQVAASIAALTQGGLDAPEAVTALRGALSALLDPTAQAEELLKGVGFSIEEVQSKIATEGLLPTLFDLKDAFGDNDRALSQLFPNIRGLIGVLSLTGSNAEDVLGVFERVSATTAEDLNPALKALHETAGFKLKQAFSQLQVSLIQVGATVAPVAVALAAVLRVVAPLASVLPTIAIAFLAWKAFTFVPILLNSIAIGLVNVTRGAAGVGLLEAAASLGALGPAAAVLAITLGTAAIAGQKLNAILFPGLVSAEAAAETVTGTLQAAWDAGTISLEELTRKVGYYNDTIGALPGANELAVSSFLDFTRGGADAPELLDKAGKAFAKMGADAVVAQERVANFAHMSNAELKKFRTDTVTAMSAVAGGLDSASNSWRMTAAAAVKATEIMLREQQRIAADLRKLDEIKIGDKLKAQLLELGPGMVDAFVHGNANQQARIRESLKGYDKASNDTATAVKKLLSTGMNKATSAAADVLHQGGKEGGSQFDAGVASGMMGDLGDVTAAARSVAAAAVQAAKDQIAAASPSRVMKEVGADFTIGFAQGITSKMSAVISAIQAVVGEGLSKARLLQAKELEAMASDMASKMERMVAQVQKDWDKLHAQIDDFKSSVRSGFDTIDILGGAAGLGQQLHDNLVASVQKELDAAKLAEAPADIIAALEEKLKAVTDSTVVPSAADFASFLKDQLATAQQFAAALTQLQSMGLNQGLLSELASQGPAGLPFLQALISGGADVIAGFNETQRVIDEIAGKTADSLADTYFGERLGKLGDEVDHLRDRLEIMSDRLATKVANLIEGIRADAVGHKIDDVLKALDRLAEGLAAFHVPGPGDGPGSTSTQSAPYVPGLAAMSAAGVTGAGLGFDFDYDQMAEAQVAAIDRRGGFHPVIVREEFDRSAGKYISKTGAGRRSL